MPKLDEELSNRICPHCGVGLLYPHPNLDLWVKCEFCGFCRVEKEKASHP